MELPMKDRSEELPVEERIYEAFFKKVDANTEIPNDLVDRLRDLHSSGILTDSPKVAEAILETTGTTGNEDAA